MKKKLFSSRFTVIGLILLLLLSLLAGIELVSRKIIPPRAEAGVPKLFFTVQPTPLQAGSNFDLSVKVNPNNASFYAFELYFTYDPEKIEIPTTTPEDAASTIRSPYSIIRKSVNHQTQTITIIGTRTGTPFSGSTNQEIATVSLKVKEETTGFANFTWKEETKLGDNLRIEKINGVFPIGEQPPELGAKLYFASAVNHGPYQPGEVLNLDVLLDTNDLEVKSVDVVLFYDDTRLTFQYQDNLLDNIYFVETSGFDTNFAIKNIDPDNKKISFALTAKSAENSPIPVTGNNKHLATIRFKIKDDASPGDINFVADQSSNVYNLDTQNILTERPPHTVTVGGEIITPKLTARLKGTSVEGGFPEVNIYHKAKDAEGEMVKLKSEPLIVTDEYQDYSFSIPDLTPQDAIDIEFTNDANNPGVEDRNLYVDYITIQRQEEDVVSNAIIEAEDHENVKYEMTKNGKIFPVIAYNCQGCSGNSEMRMFWNGKLRFNQGPSPELGHISGTVKDTGNQPIEGATVELLLAQTASEEPGSYQPPTYTTGQYGWYAFWAIEPGTYTVKASKEGVGSQQITVELTAYKHEHARFTLGRTTLTPPADCLRKSQGDVNCDGAIDGVDFVMWLNSQCPPQEFRASDQTCADLRADFDQDDDVDDDDLQIWIDCKFSDIDNLPDACQKHQ